MELVIYLAQFRKYEHPWIQPPVDFLLCMFFAHELVHWLSLAILVICLAVPEKLKKMAPF